MAPGLAGLKHNFLPGLVLQVCALLIVLGYAYLPSFRLGLDQIGAIKQNYGYGYSALSTALFGGLIPFVVLLTTRQIPRHRLGAEFLFYVLFWTWKGVEVDAFYRLQGFIFGNLPTVATIAKKGLVDQFIYNPLWAGPTQVVFFLWKDAGFSWRGLRAQLNKESLVRRVIVILLSSWMIWVPTVMIVYSLPDVLQIPLFNLVICFWCLLLSFVSRKSS